MISWKSLTGGKNIEGVKNLLVLVIGLLTILSSPFWGNVIPKDQASVKLYAVNWSRHSAPGGKVSTTHLKDVLVDLTYQVDYILANGGSTPIEINDYIDPITVEGVDGAMVLSAGSKYFDAEKTTAWESEDGKTWKIRPVFLNPGDRLIITLYVGAHPKKDWVERDIYEGLKWSGKFRGSNIQKEMELGGKLLSAYVGWYFFGFYVHFSESAAYIYLLFVFVFYFTFMWFLLPKVSLLKSRGTHIGITFICLILAFTTADGTHSILFPSFLFGNTSRYAVNWAAALIPIILVVVAFFALPGKKAAKTRSPRSPE